MTNLKFDPVHSSLEFSIRHLMVSKIKGTFNDYTVDVKGDADDLSSLETVATINVDSIDTKNPDRDNHLKTADFFNVESHQQIIFKSKAITENKITGDLTIAGQTNEETFDFEQHGVSDNPLSGGQVTGFTVTGTIDREKYGMNFNQALETGGVMLGKDVKFEFHGEFTIEG
ncbi:YceI family protein [Staphylococcus intermedius]|uniref:YceI-like domain-containing protein n=1 Tax=Staphylococcus intermedius NCTC 11048 TaxID=1141106 RepID=A0A380G5L1_STAIN|nr:YceI family protein [Staphylococcus intermedius]PCF64124.1 polyisoprenoid-binding protein [Staphylococcus intermedius]PCF78839.1 polyisoprenoid-binding protein [Staphylococcus intermedius]PCF79812.1 polyisoprenoid-binding protein [Staphylococcus intermedius]PCF85007.1 polyisoprenoid-binding protein [Staphylococcus intermedius]PCF89529.1 polyisoprenoid-binding protein [Staphylococcus intermedius]